MRREGKYNICPLQNLYYDNSNPLSKNLKFSKFIKSKTRDYYTTNANQLYEIYLELCSKLEIGNPSVNLKPKYPYNILIAPNWISIVRRSKDNAHGFSLNALAFAGYILNTAKSDNLWLRNKKT